MPKRGRMILICFLLASSMEALADERPKLELPVRCEVGQTCFIQNYVDRDPTLEAKDFTCGSMTYDGHNGTDFRIPSLVEQRAGVDVLAAADGARDPEARRRSRHFSP